MNNLAFYLAQIYYNLTGQTVTPIPTGFTDSHWSELIYRYAAGLPSGLSGGKNASFWLENWYYVRTGQSYRRATGTLPAWFWLAKLYDQVLRGSAHDPNGQVGYNSAEFWASRLATLAFAVPFTPLALGSKLYLWNKSGTGLFQDSAGTTPANTTNDPIGRWTDQSGNNRHSTQVTASNKGIRASDDSVRFVLQDWLNLVDLSALTMGEIFIRVKVDTDPPVEGGDGGFWKFGTDPQESAIPYTDGNVYDGFGATVRKSTGNPGVSFATAYRVYQALSKANRWTSWIDGNQHFTTGTNTVAFTANPRIGSSGTLWMVGQVSDVILCNAELTADERVNVLAYLGVL